MQRIVTVRKELMFFLTQRDRDLATQNLSYWQKPSPIAHGYKSGRAEITVMRKLPNEEPRVLNIPVHPSACSSANLLAC